MTQTVDFKFPTRIEGIDLSKCEWVRISTEEARSIHDSGVGLLLIHYDVQHQVSDWHPTTHLHSFGAWQDGASFQDLNFRYYFGSSAVHAVWRKGATRGDDGTMEFYKIKEYGLVEE